jgi:BNR/Asp-box repeat protein
MKANYLAMLVLVGACGMLRAAEAPKHEHAHKHGGSGAVSLDVWGEGKRIHVLSVVLEEGKAAVLQYQRSEDGGTLSAPVAVGKDQAPPEPIRRGMDAQIAGHGDKLVAVWTTAGKEDRFGRGPLATAISDDGGKTWRAGPNPSDFPAAIGHAFIEIAADEKGVFHLVWIDGRDRSGTGATPAGKGLRYARSMDGGASWSANRTLDGATCECCWNTIAIAKGGHVAVLYRDKEPRDMSIARSNDGGVSWEPSVAVGTFNWDVNVCPHVGGGLAFGSSTSANQVFATVWTGKAGTFGSYLLSSADGGEHWSAPARIGDFQALHTDVAAMDNGRIAVVWDAGAQGGVIFAMTSDDGGKTWSAKQISEEGAVASHPRIVAAPDGFRIFWTETRTGNASNLKMRKL